MDIPLVITILGITAGLAVLVLFLVLVAGIRADDRIKEPHDGPRTEIEHLTRRLLMYANPRKRPEDSRSEPNPDQDRWR